MFGTLAPFFICETLVRRTLVDLGVLRGFARLLACNTCHILMALHSAEKVLRLGEQDAEDGVNKAIGLFESSGCVDWLQQLSRDINEDVCAKAGSILTCYFPDSISSAVLASSK